MNAPYKIPESVLVVIHTAALKQLWLVTWNEAQTMTYSDAFLLVGDFDVLSLFAGGAIVILVVTTMCSGVLLAALIAT